MKPEYQQLHWLVSRTHGELYNTLANIRASSGRSADLQQLADLAYTLREIEELLDDSRKDVKRLYEQLSGKICLLHFAAAQRNGGLKADPIRTVHCTVTPTVKMSANTPSAKQAPELYAAFMRSLGASDEHIAKDTLRPHWPAVTEWLSAKIAAGEQIPDGFDPEALRPVYSLLIRANAPVQEQAASSAVAADGSDVPF